MRFRSMDDHLDPRWCFLQGCGTTHRHFPGWRPTRVYDHLTNWCSRRRQRLELKVMMERLSWFSMSLPFRYCEICLSSPVQNLSRGLCCVGCCFDWGSSSALLTLGKDRFLKRQHALIGISMSFSSEHRTRHLRYEQWPSRKPTERMAWLPCRQHRAFWWFSTLRPLTLPMKNLRSLQRKCLCAVVVSETTKLSNDRIVSSMGHNGWNNDSG
jgi:hypothetical protein